MSINGRNNVLSFHIFDVSKHKEVPGEYEKIADLFEQSEKNLCIHNEKKIMNLYAHFGKDMGFNCDYVYYLKKEQKQKSKSTFSKMKSKMKSIFSETEKDEIKEEIIAFAFIEKTNDQNIYTVKILCSHTGKYQYQNENAGIFLLNKIYHDFVSNKKGVLCIQPATKDLIRYYTNWRKPSYSPFDSEGVSTRGHLLYFENIDNITDEMLYELVSELS